MLASRPLLLPSSVAVDSEASLLRAAANADEPRFQAAAMEALLRVANADAVTNNGGSDPAEGTMEGDLPRLWTQLLEVAFDHIQQLRASELTPAAHAPATSDAARASEAGRDGIADDDASDDPLDVRGRAVCGRLALWAVLPGLGRLVAPVDGVAPHWALAALRRVVASWDRCGHVVTPTPSAAKALVAAHHSHATAIAALAESVVARVDAATRASSRGGRPTPTTVPKHVLRAAGTLAELLQHHALPCTQSTVAVCTIVRAAGGLNAATLATLDAIDATVMRIVRAGIRAAQAAAGASGAAPVNVPSTASLASAAEAAVAAGLEGLASPPLTQRVIAAARA